MTSVYANTINSFKQLRILVIGDLVLDIYLNGSSRRLCPEAPVPVVDIQARVVVPGGAANTVCNLRSLGAMVTFCSVVGNDAAGDEAIRILRGLGIDDDQIIRDSQRNTITKSRVVSSAQVITRFDEGSDNPVSQQTEEVLMRSIEEAYRTCDAIVLSDYDKGLITPGIVDLLGRLRREAPKFIAVDSKRLQFFAALRPSYVKPNYEESIRLLNLPTEHGRRGQQISAHSHRLAALTGASLISVTLDSEGSVIIYNGQVVDTLIAPHVSRPHVSGAGDTYLSAFVLGYMSSGDAAMSAALATAASTIAVTKEGTSSCSMSELKAYFNIQSKFVSDLDELADLCDSYRAAGRRIVFTNGCFDILHSGHVAYLRKARALGDVLIVGLNTDESIKRIKGRQRPINGLADRLQVLGGLSSVDHIIPFGDLSDDTPIPLIKVIRPDVFAKGGDYTKEKLPEADTVEACGGEIVFLDHIPDHSTTRIINRIASAANTTYSEATSQ